MRRAVSSRTRSQQGFSWQPAQFSSESRTIIRSFGLL